MDDTPNLLLWCGGIGWFLLTFLIASGNDKGWLRNLLVTAFMWVICIDIIGILAGIIVPVLHKLGIGWRFVAFFVVLPYLLCLLRLRWLWRARGRAITGLPPVNQSSPSPPA